MAGENWEFWLTVTNIILGMATVLALVVVASAVGRELLARWRSKVPETEGIDAEMRAMFNAGTHSITLPELGLTMADGGERIEPSKPESKEKKSPRK